MPLEQEWGQLDPILQISFFGKEIHKLHSITSRSQRKEDIEQFIHKEVELPVEALMSRVGNNLTLWRWLLV